VLRWTRRVVGVESGGGFQDKDRDDASNFRLVFGAADTLSLSAASASIISQPASVASVCGNWNRGVFHLKPILSTLLPTGSP